MRATILSPTTCPSKRCPYGCVNENQLPQTFRSSTHSGEPQRQSTNAFGSPFSSREKMRLEANIVS